MNLFSFYSTFSDCLSRTTSNRKNCWRLDESLNPKVKVCVGNILRSGWDENWNPLHEKAHSLLGAYNQHSFRWNGISILITTDIDHKHLQLTSPDCLKMTEMLNGTDNAQRLQPGRQIQDPFGKRLFLLVYCRRTRCGRGQIWNSPTHPQDNPLHWDRDRSAHTQQLWIW